MAIIFASVAMLTFHFDVLKPVPKSKDSEKSLEIDSDYDSLEERDKVDAQVKSNTAIKRASLRPRRRGSSEICDIHFFDNTEIAVSSKMQTINLNEHFSCSSRHKFYGSEIDWK